MQLIIVAFHVNTIILLLVSRYVNIVAFLSEHYSYKYLRFHWCLST